MIFLIASGLVLLAIVLAWVFAKRQPGWKMWKVVLIASAPGPIAISLLCLIWFAVIWVQPSPCTHCDNPGMALFGLMMIATVGSFMVFVLSALFSWLTVQSLRS